METRDLHWAAGFMEAEGSFTFSGAFVVSAAQIEREPLDKLQVLFGGYINYVKRKDGHKPVYRWGLNAANAVGVALTLYCLMSKKRQAQVRKSLDAWKLLPLAGRAAKYKKACINGHPYTETSVYAKRGFRECLQCRADVRRRREGRIKAHA